MTKSKKFISLFLVFSLVMLSVNLHAKERRGAKLSITRKNDGKIKGELLVVKQNLLLLLLESGIDVTIDIRDIQVIKIKKRSKALWGAGIGLLVGVPMGLVQNTTVKQEAVYDAMNVMGWSALGAICGGLIGAAPRLIPQTIQIEGMTDSEINEVLAKLRKKARVRDYR
jgi:hypothetical protein